MRVKLTDLLDDLELAPELLPLPEAKRPTRARTERLVLQRLGISRRRVRSAGRTLLAAVLAAAVIWIKGRLKKWAEKDRK